MNAGITKTIMKVKTYIYSDHKLKEMYPKLTIYFYTYFAFVSLYVDLNNNSITENTKFYFKRK